MKMYAIFNNCFFTRKPWWLPAKLYNVVSYRANPRTQEYMLNVLAEQFPNALLTTIEKIPNGTEHIILLYSDAIGIGLASLEKKCLKKFKTITVLTGRKRIFILDRIQHSSLLLKRFLEITFLPELCFAPLLLIMGTCLAVKDNFKGHS